MTWPTSEQIVTWSTIAGGTYTAYRAVLKPKILKPCRAFVGRLNSALHKVDLMSTALGPNGGKSLADQISSTHQKVSLTEARVTGLSDFLETPLFEANPQGEYTRVNRAFELLFGYSPAELAGMGWVTIVRPEERDRVVREWQSAVAQRRAYWTTAVYVTRAGGQVHVIVRAQPVVDGKAGSILGWFGAIAVHKVIEAQPTS